MHPCPAVLCALAAREAKGHIYPSLSCSALAPWACAQELVRLLEWRDLLSLFPICTIWGLQSPSPHPRLLPAPPLQSFHCSRVPTACQTLRGSSQLCSSSEHLECQPSALSPSHCSETETGDISGVLQLEVAEAETEGSPELCCAMSWSHFCSGSV